MVSLPPQQPSGTIFGWALINGCKRFSKPWEESRSCKVWSSPTEKKSEPKVPLALLFKFGQVSEIIEEKLCLLLPLSILLKVSMQYLYE